MITVSFNSPITMFNINEVDRNEVNLFFKDLIGFLYLNGVVEHKLISDRLYRRYVRKNDVRKTYQIIKCIERDFLEKYKKKSDLYYRFISAFYSACEETIELEGMGVIRKKHLQIGLFIPYGLEEKEIPDSFYDSLPDTAPAFWLRTISMKEYVEKYSTHSTTKCNKRKET